MDYTTLANVKAALGPVTGSTNDALLSAYVTRASRFIDRWLTGVAGPASDDYLQAETVTDEQIAGRYNGGRILTNPRKPLVSGVTTAAWRKLPSDAWNAVTAANAVADGGRVDLYTGATVVGAPGARVFVKLTYTGGLAADAASLPADVVEAATLMAIRLYREALAGESDVIGVSEFGQVFYQKALPQRFEAMLQPYRRVLPWSGAL